MIREVYVAADSRVERDGDSRDVLSGNSYPDGPARQERHPRDENRCLQPRHQPTVAHGTPQLFDC